MHVLIQALRIRHRPQVLVRLASHNVSHRKLHPLAIHSVGNVGHLDDVSGNVPTAQRLLDGLLELGAQLPVQLPMSELYEQ